MHVCPFASKHFAVKPPLHAIVVSHIPGSCVPVGKLEHVPTLPVRLQDLQTSVQGVLQQTPSTQLLDGQSLGAVHVITQSEHFGPPQSRPVSLPFLMPSLQEMHFELIQLGDVPEQSLLVKHSTQSPASLQTLSPKQLVPAITTTLVQVPFTHARVLQGIGTGQS
jgi:hypothetical protein